MQGIIQWGKSITEYQSEFENIKVENPEKCKCGCTKFHKWGKYKRFVVDENVDYSILIKRICCVKCRTTYSFLPSFCVSKACFSIDSIMFFLKVLLMKLKFELDNMKRQAYKFLRRFTETENLWIVFLRTKGLNSLPTDKKERRVKIFTALLEIHKNEKLILSFFMETGRHFMTKNENKNNYLSQ